MKVIGVLGKKGGIGKTTSAIGIAGHYVSQGLSVMMIDLDPEGRACYRICNRRNGKLKGRVVRVRKDKYDSLSVILQKMKEADDVDVVVIDTPPRSDHSFRVVVKALKEFDGIALVPCMRGLVEIELAADTAGLIQECIDNPVFVLPTNMKKRRRLTKLMHATVNKLEDVYILPDIWERENIIQASALGQTIQEIDRDAAELYAVAVNAMEQTINPKEAEYHV